MRRLWPALLLAGCGGGQGLFPTQVGSHHEYVIKNGMAVYVEAIRATKEVAVAGSRGVELGGPMGISRVAWKDGTLYASLLGGTRFVPPIPILVAAAPDKAITTKTMAETEGVQRQARVTLVHSKEKIKIGTRDVETVRTLLTLNTDANVITVETHYADGSGMVRQQQHVDGQFDLSLDLLN